MFFVCLFSPQYLLGAEKRLFYEGINSVVFSIIFELDSWPDRKNTKSQLSLGQLQNAVK